MNIKVSFDYLTAETLRRKVPELIVFNRDYPIWLRSWQAESGWANIQAIAWAFLPYVICEDLNCTRIIAVSQMGCIKFVPALNSS